MKKYILSSLMVGGVLLFGASSAYSATIQVDQTLGGSFYSLPNFDSSIGSVSLLDRSAMFGSDASLISSTSDISIPGAQFHLSSNGGSSVIKYGYSFPDMGYQICATDCSFSENVYVSQFGSGGDFYGKLTNLVFNVTSDRALSFNSTVEILGGTGYFSGATGTENYAGLLISNNPLTPTNPLDSGTFTATFSASIVTAPVPEPETYAMILAGLGLIGGISRRRIRK